MSEDVVTPEEELPPEEPEITPEEQAEPVKLKPGAMPQPPGRMHRGRAMTTPIKFFTYWFKLKPTHRGRVLVYAYRDWPKCDPMQVLTPQEIELIGQKKKQPPPKNIEKWADPPFTNAENWKYELLRRFGAGSYRLLMNDEKGKAAEGKKQSGSSALCGCYVEPKDFPEFGDLDNYEPSLNPDFLVMTAPENESYIRHCKVKGIRLPGDPPTPFDREETEDMANTEVVRESLGMVNRMVDKVMQDSERNSAPAPTPAPQDGSIARAVDAVASSFEKTFDILGKGLDRMNERKEKAEDPMEHVKQIVEISRSLVPPPQPPAPAPANDPVVAALLEDRKAMREELSELRKSNTAQLEARLAAAEARLANPTAAQAAAANPLETFMGMLKAFSSAKELLVDSMGLGAEEEKPESKLETYAKIFMPAAVSGLSNIASIVYNVTKGNKPAIPPTDAPPSSNPALPGAQVPMNMLGFLEAITEDLKSAVINQANGSEFAAMMIMKHGQPALSAYNEVATWGDQVLTRVSMYPPLGSFRAEHPDEFDQFIGEFMDGNAVQQLLQEATQRQQQPQQPRRVPRPKPDSRPQ